MFKGLIFFVRFFAFWLLFFFIDRLVFLFIFRDKLTAIGLSEIIRTFFYGLRLDISMAAYLNSIPLFVFIYWLFTSRNQVALIWLRGYNGFFIIAASLLSLANFNIYREWGTKVNERAFGFLIDTPNEALASSASSPLLLSSIVLIALITIGFFLHKRIVPKYYASGPGNVVLKTALAVLLLGLNFLAIRGGVDVAPNNQSMAYFSRHQILNHAAVNTEWNFLSSMLASKKTRKNPYEYFNTSTARQITDSLYHIPQDTSLSVLRVARPNVVLFILESFTADLTQALGNESGITPHFDSLINQGLFFTQIYAAGNRTDKGLIATLTGFPTLGTGSIVKWPEKMQKIPAISQKLAEAGYQTSFYYGGESEFDNYKAFLLSHRYQTLVDKNSFNPKDMNSKWGAYDGLVFNRQLNDMASQDTPFFSTILSLTNHEPFEVPGTYKFGTKTLPDRFKSTAFYTDSCIASYLDAARKQDWYKNTLFIFVADHGHLYPKDKYEIYMPQRYHIPLLFYGDVLKKEYRGKKMDKVGSQQDIASTLLKQLHLDAQDFIWSKNLLNPYTPDFAFFSWDNGLGFISNSQCITFDNIGRTTLYRANLEEGEASTLLGQGKAYLQNAYQQFIGL